MFGMYDQMSASPSFRKRPFKSIMKWCQRHSLIPAFLSALLMAVTSTPGLLRAQGLLRVDEGLQDLANIAFRSDLRLFTVMAALNRCGFDYEIPGKNMSPVRRAVRAELERQDSPAIAELCAFYRSHEFADPTEAQSAYTSLALVLSGPPSFELVVSADELPSDVRPIAGFEKLLPRFFAESELNSLWHLSQPHYFDELKKYQPVVKEVIRQTLDYFRISPRIALDRQIILIVDLLSQKNVVNARNMERVYYLAVGPAQDPRANFSQLQHGYLHFLVDPLTEKFSADLVQEEGFQTISRRQPELDSRFESSTLLQATESLIEAIQVRTLSEREFETDRVRLFQKGLVLFPYFYRALAQFETKEEETFPIYVEKILKAASVSVVEQDEKEINEIVARRQQDRETAEAELALRQQRESRQAEKQKLFNEAGRELGEGRYEEAKVTLQALLELAPDNGNAYFYLGQIAAQEREHEAAYQYYQKAAQSAEVDDWAKAWAVLRSGNYLASQARYQEARDQFEQVLALEGDLQGAREEAAEALARLKQPQP